MKTMLLQGDEKGIKTAAEIIKAGGLCAIPTETVYGLAASALNSAAVENIFKAKGRPQDNPLIIHIAQTDEIYNYVTDFCEKAKNLPKNFGPDL